MDTRRKEIGRRLKAYRIGSRLKAEEIAHRLNISRSALYRMEAGEIVKIEMLDALAHVLNTSLASLLGVGVEYYQKAGAYFERMRQLEAAADQVVARFMPVSFLLTTAEYSTHLRQMLIESLPSGELPPEALAEIETIMAILGTRKSAHKPRVVALMSVPEVERFLQLGLIGRFGLPHGEWMRRRAAARREIENIVHFLTDQRPGIEVGLVDEMLPNMAFQLFQSRKETVLAVSPFRISEMPNIRHGVATVTAAPEAVALYEKLASDLWGRALKGPRAAARLAEVIARSAADGTAEMRLTRAPTRRRKSRH